MEAFQNAEPGDDVTLTTVRDGVELELTGMVTDRLHEPPEGYREGYLQMDVELSNDSVAALQEREGDGEWFRNVGHNVNIHAKETRHGAWKDVDIAVWDPVADGSMVVEHRYTSLGELRSVDVDASD